MAAVNQRRFALSAPTINPILIKELRSQMRGPRAFVTLTTFLLLLSGVAYFFYISLQQQSQWGSPIPLSVMLGSTMFLGLTFVIMFLIAFVTPALTAGTISGERESMTYEMLIATPLRPIWILTGKMTAAMTYVFLLMLATIPMMSLVYIFGGVTIPDMAKTLLILVVMAFCYGTIGLFWSSLLGRTSRATVASYLTVALLLIMPTLANLVYPVFNQMNPTPPIVLSVFNPFAAIASVPTGSSTTQMLGMYGGPLYFIFGMLTGMTGYWGPTPDFSTLNHPIWHWTLTVYGLFALVLGLISIVLVRPAGRGRIRWWEPLLFILIVGGVIGAFGFVFSFEDIAQLFSIPGWDAMPRPMPAVDLPIRG
jgi:ABC-2 type transport system permease protein